MPAGAAPRLSAPGLPVRTGGSVKACHVKPVNVMSDSSSEEVSLLCRATKLSSGEPLEEDPEDSGSDDENLDDDEQQEQEGTVRKPLKVAAAVWGCFKQPA